MLGGAHKVRDCHVPAPSLRSGFRLRAQTPAKRLNFARKGGALRMTIVGTRVRTGRALKPANAYAAVLFTSTPAHFSSRVSVAA